ncbi:hypothetical protein B0H16DRAFT_1715221 [Mycena metata]|uniref:Uncharacterized protein n=1 Tax=Mycena metata TaxID=1033252 RepID=A0AAD7NPV6_9AGAR|nr:hypothetical protein B0H16DRAFT_1715221 [Mycena metata]
MPLAWEAEALEYVRAMNVYLAKHANCALVLTQDPTLRDTLISELNDPKHPLVRSNFQVGPEEDEMDLLNMWDTALLDEPQTFRDHFLQLQYAVSGSMVYNKLFILPAVQKYGPEFHIFYPKSSTASFESSMKTILPTPPQINSTAPTTATPPSAEIPNIDTDTAAALLSTPDTLFGLYFYHRDELMPAYWHVVAISTKQTPSGRYKFFEADFEGEVIEVRAEDMSTLLLASCVVP